MRFVALVVLASLLAVAGFVTLSLAAFTSTSSSAVQVTAATDWTPPVVTLADPGSPLRGTVTLTATATDLHSSVASVTIERSPAGQATWSAVCTRTAAPHSCAWDTTAVVDGAYDLRAVATDTSGNTGRSAVRAARVVDNQAPTVALVDVPVAVRGTVTITATAADAGTGVTSVRIQRSPAESDTWTDLCTRSSAPYSCTWNTAGTNGEFDLRAIATDGAGNSTTSAIESTTVDNTAPTVTVNVPTGTLSGTVTIAATANDVHTDVAQVELQYGAGTNPSSWTTFCVDATRPFSCRLDTTQMSSAPILGSTYSFRAIATDLAGNTATSSTVSRTVNNTAATIALGDVPSFSRGTVTLTATTNAVLVSAVRFERAPQGSNTWATICTTSAAPYTCEWDTTAVTDGTYQLRAVVRYGLLGLDSATSPVETTTVDNTPLTGLDIQTTNGGTAGRVDAGDVITYTYSEQLDLTSLIAGWDGTARSGQVRLRDGGLVGGGNFDDTIDVFLGTNNLNTPVHLGTVNLRGDYIRESRSQNVNATLTAATETIAGKPVTVVRVTLTASPPPGQLRTSSATSTMIWTPSANARDLAGNRTSTSPVTESGPTDRDF